MLSAAELAADAANRALASEAWAREKLAAHAGKRFTLSTGPIDATFSIVDEGELAAAESGAAVALTLRVSPLDVPRLAADPSRWGALVRVDGDAALAATLGELAGTFPWFVERALGSLLGPIAGQTVADVGRTLLSVPDRISRHAASSLGAFAGETDALVTRTDLLAHAVEVADVGARVDALASRVEALDAAPAKRRRSKSA